MKKFLSMAMSLSVFLVSTTAQAEESKRTDFADCRRAIVDLKDDLTPKNKGPGKNPPAGSLKDAEMSYVKQQLEARAERLGPPFRRLMKNLNENRLDRALQILGQALGPVQATLGKLEPAIMLDTLRAIAADENVQQSIQQISPLLQAVAGPLAEVAAKKRAEIMEVLDADEIGALVKCMKLGETELATLARAALNSSVQLATPEQRERAQKVAEHERKASLKNRNRPSGSRE